MNDLLKNFACVLDEIGVKQQAEEENCNEKNKTSKDIDCLIEKEDDITTKDNIKKLEEEIFGNNDKIENRNNKENKKKDEKIDIYSGHRQRARERFLKNPDETSDYDLLELILFLVIPRADTKPTAKKLLDKYGSIMKVFEANDEDLTKTGINGKSLKYLESLMWCFYRRIMRQRLNTNNNLVIDNIDLLVDYCRAKIGALTSEEFHIIFFNSKFDMIEDKKFGIEDVSSVSLSFRELLKTALSNGAKNIILYHNHPNGNIEPSKEDIEMTEYIKDSFSRVNIILAEHIIITSNNYYSFKKNFLI